MRESGILMPVSSLPGPYGIGCFGKAAFQFVDFLSAAGQTIWQLLPLSPTGYGDSPYQSCSAFAGNPYFIDLDALKAEGLLTAAQLKAEEWGENPLEVDYGVVEAAQAMGSTTFQIVRKVLIPEAMPSLVNGFAICITTILGYTAMAGTAGGDGLGKVAITYGLNKRQYDVMYAASIVLVLLVQFFQMGGTWLSHAIDHRRRK